MTLDSSEVNISAYEVTEDHPTIYLVHGSFHSPAHWLPLRHELEKKGLKTAAVDLPIKEPDATFADFADIICGSIENEKNAVLLLHSRASNAGPLVAANLSLRQIVYLNAGFERNNNARFDNLMPWTKTPPKHWKDYISGIKLISDDNLMEYDPQKAKEVFYHDCDTATAQWAVSNLRPQYRTGNQPPVPEECWHTDVPSTHILSLEDRVLDPRYCRHVAKRWFGASSISLAGGHCPFISRPKELAGVLQTLIKNGASLKNK